MENLSGDLLFSIFRELDAATLCILSQVSKDFNVAADNDDAWVAVHGFSKTSSRVIIAKLIVSIAELGKTLADASYTSSCADDIYFAVDPSNIEAENLARSNFTTAHQLWNDAEYNFEQARQNLAIAYRMLRVPVALRVATACALHDYYRACDNCELQHLKKSVVIVHAARDALKIKELEVVMWEATPEQLNKRLAYTYTAAFCCARSPWAPT